MFRLRWRVRIALESLLRTAEEARLLRRVQALVWRSQGESVSKIAARLQVSRQTVHNWLARFQARAGCPLRERLRDEERPGRPPTAKGIIDAVIEPLLECDPRAFGYAATVWTAPLLRRHLERAQQIPVSERSVRRAIHRLGYGWKRPRYRLALRPATWRQAKGELKSGLRKRQRTVVLMLDETIVTETPPLYNRYGKIGGQVEVPVPVTGPSASCMAP